MYITATSSFKCSELGLPCSTPFVVLGNTKPGFCQPERGASGTCPQGRHAAVHGHLRIHSHLRGKQLRLTLESIAVIVIKSKPVLSRNLHGISLSAIVCPCHGRTRMQSQLYLIRAYTLSSLKAAHTSF